MYDCFRLISKKIITNILQILATLNQIKITSF